MKKLQISILIFISGFTSCKRGDHQTIAVKNLSQENIYFLVSGDSVLRNPNEINLIRPIMSEPKGKLRIEGAEYDSSETTKQNLYRYLIEKDSMEIVLSSESVGIFLNANSIKQIIRDRYNGQLHIFIITESILLNYTDLEIIEMKLYKHFETLTSESVTEDKLILNYK